MANTRHPGPSRTDLHGPHAARTPGVLGHNDVAQPFCITQKGDSRGPTGDAFAIIASTSTHRDANSSGENEEVFIINKKDLVDVFTSAEKFVTSPEKSLPAAKDMNEIRKLMAEFGFTGRYYVKAYKGTDYVIFKGYAGLRKIIKGTKYLTKNAKIVSMGLGRTGVMHSGIKGGVFSIVVVAGVDIVKYFLEDQSTLGQLGLNLLRDLSKAALAAAIGTAAGFLAVAAVGVFATVPVALGVGVSFVVGMLIGEPVADEVWEYLEKNPRCCSARSSSAWTTTRAKFSPPSARPAASSIRLARTWRTRSSFSWRWRRNTSAPSRSSSACAACSGCPSWISDSASLVRTPGARRLQSCISHGPRYPRPHESAAFCPAAPRGSRRRRG